MARRLMSQDLELEFDRLSRPESGSVRCLAELVGKANARQMDASTRKQFAASLNRDKATQLNAAVLPRVQHR